MMDSLTTSELLEGFEPSDVARIEAIARPITVPPRSYLFMLGDRAEALYFVRSGEIELCLPVVFGGVREISVEQKGPGSVVGWSALVKPFRFTVSGRATCTTRLASIPRGKLTQLLAERPVLGLALMSRVAELIGLRYFRMRALWARELQRSIMLESRQTGNQVPPPEQAD